MPNGCCKMLTVAAFEGLKYRRSETLQVSITPFWQTGARVDGEADWSYRSTESRSDKLICGWIKIQIEALDSMFQLAQTFCREVSVIKQSASKRRD